MRQLISFLFLSLCITGTAIASNTKLDFSLHKLESGVDGPTILVIGGIQGDEPGGFTAASLLVTDYQITRGNVWVVPNLNFESIIKRSRGVYGDMNRKFSHLTSNDPEYDTVERIKSIILSDEVDIILNLHDGSGFYRTEYIDKWRNPRRWGQSVIIDQEKINVPRYGELGQLARWVVSQANSVLGESANRFEVKNTETRLGDVEMEKTLTYFAIRHNKPAFGVEASKKFVTHERAYYHLLVLEAYMKLLGVGYQRNFPLNLASVKQAIDDNVKIAIYDKIYLDVAKARRRLGYIPLKKDSPLEFTASNPLVAVISDKNHYKVRYGNRHVTQIYPQYFEYDNSIDSIDMSVDGIVSKVPIGSVVDVNEHFKVEPLDGYRVNIIGYTQAGKGDESGFVVRHQDFLKRYSVDTDAQMYRVEVYQQGRFSGMVLVRFSDNAMAQQSSTNNLSSRQDNASSYASEQLLVSNKGR